MALNKVAKRRILKLVEFMESLPRSAEKHFDMGSWFTHNGGHDLPIKYNDPITAAVMKDCGTTACALGWAATMPYFRKLGLRAHYVGDVGDVFVNGQQVGTLRTHGILAQEIFPVGDDDIGGDDRLFDLFAGSNADPTPKAWARRVRKLVKKWDAAESA